MHVFGIDPGHRSTGIVLLDKGALVTAKTVSTRSTTVVAPDTSYVLEAVEALKFLYLTMLPFPDGVLVAIEGVVNPNPHGGKRRKKTLQLMTTDEINNEHELQLINTSGIAGTAAVAGAVALWVQYLDVPVIIVNPHHNGKGPYYEYPIELHDPRGGCRTDGRCNPKCASDKGANRHVRSAWDVGKKGETLYRMRTAV